jgi:DNA polymerase-3 subunit delta'
MPFSEIIGHDRPVTILKRALANHSLAHAYLFSGEQGIGKRMTALSLAAALNCAAPGPDGGCGSCASCRKVAAASHPDVHLLLPDGDEIKIDQVRQLQADLSLKAFEGKRKVLIVDGAESMNEPSSNAFLKTLEEPPGDSLIILISSLPHGLLATIRSRCQEVKFQPLPRKTLAAVLREQRGLGEEDAWFLAALARGSLGRALAMDLNDERSAREQFLALVYGLGAMRHDETLTLAERFAKDRDGFERFLDMGTEWLRDRAVFGQTADERLLIFSENAARDRESGRRPSLPKVLQDLELFTRSRILLERRVSAQLVAENLFLRLRTQ